MKRQLIVYGQNQKEAMLTFRQVTEGLVPTKAEYAGTKHGAKVYLVTYRKNKRKN